MKKHDFEALMARYRESLGSCSRVPERKPKRVWVRPVASLGAVVILAILALILLWPKDAAATAIDRMSHALKGVTHFQATGYQLWEGKWKEMTEVNYADGVWSLKRDTKNDTFLCIASDDGLLIHYKRLPYVLKTPKYYEINQEMIGNRSVLDFVLRHIDSGYYRIGRKQTVVDRGSTLALQLSRQKGGYKAEVIIDKATNRPLSAVVSSYADDTNKGPQYMERYNFGYESIPNPVLPDKPVVDTQLELAKLTPAWERALASSKKEIIDARVSSSGTVWLVASYDRSMKKVRLPYRILVGSKSYRPMRFFAGTASAYNDDLRIGGKSIAVMGFALPERTRNATTCKVILGDYATGVFLEFLDNEPTPEDSLALAIPSYSLSLKRDPDPVPRYFATLSLCDEQISMRSYEAYARAGQLRDELRFDEAIHAYEQIGRELSEFESFTPGKWQIEIDITKRFKQDYMMRMRR